MRWHEVICETAEFDAFLANIFDQYNVLSRETNRQRVLTRGRHIIRILRNYTPADDDEQINVETGVELFEELIRKAGGVP